MASLIDILDCTEHIHLLKFVMPLLGIDRSVLASKSALDGIVWLPPGKSGSDA
jgi:hypothetical protein